MKTTKHLVKGPPYYWGDPMLSMMTQAKSLLFSVGQETRVFNCIRTKTGKGQVMIKISGSMWLRPLGKNSSLVRLLYSPGINWGISIVHTVGTKLNS